MPWAGPITRFSSEKLEIAQPQHLLRMQAQSCVVHQGYQQPRIRHPASLVGSAQTSLTRRKRQAPPCSTGQ